LEGVVQALYPRDALQEALANSIARMLLRDLRIDIFETHALNGADRMTLSERKALGDEDWLWSQIDLAEQLSSWLRAHYERDAATWTRTTPSLETDADSGTYETFADFWRFLRGEVKVRDLWDDDHKPSTEQEWRRVFMALVTHAFAGPASMEVWLTGLRRTWFADYQHVRGRRAEAVAKRSVKERSERRTCAEVSAASWRRR
jgi:hypothetical protein